MASRSFVSSTPVIKQDVMATNFENMLNRVNNMIKGDMAYSVWIRVRIGTNNPIVFDSSSTAKDENMFMSFEYKKSGAGTANQFKFQVAFDLFDYGQTTRGRVERLDELLYNAMNVVALDNAKDIFYCRFQYGYNVTGNTQIVSPCYEGLITGIEPSVDYTNGKTYYTITGTSYVEGSQLKHSFNAIDGNGWNAMDLVLWILWYYHGNPNTVSSIFDSAYHGRDGSDRDESVQNGIAPMFNIDIPAELRNTCTNVVLEKVDEMTAIDYCKYVLENTYNTSDPRYYVDNDTGKQGYKLRDGETKPYYTLYITDSGGGVPTVHVAYIGSGDAVDGIKTINFDFSWFNRTNNVVVGWKPQVNLMAYYLTRAKLEAKRLEMEQEIQGMYNKLAATNAEIQRVLENGAAHGVSYEDNPEAYAEYLNMVTEGEGGTNDQREAIELKEKEFQETIDAMRNENIEYYNSTMTLVGIPSDIPLNILLRIKPMINESVSRTQGKYYVKGATDKINTNGLFTTTLELIRYYNY